MIIQLINKGESNIALRFSEFEGIDTINNLEGNVKWVWVDCFSKIPLTNEIFVHLRKMGFKLCLVSPELQGRLQDIGFQKEYYTEQKIVFDAICTKLFNIDSWNNQ
jgi:hypothetical protein